jgi:hypothetical protein
MKQTTFAVCMRENRRWVPVSQTRPSIEDVIASCSQVLLIAANKQLYFKIRRMRHAVSIKAAEDNLRRILAS